MHPKRSAMPFGALRQSKIITNAVQPHTTPGREARNASVPDCRQQQGGSDMQVPMQYLVEKFFPSSFR